MKAWKVIGYAADADTWCVDCATTAYPGCDGDTNVEDGEGNPVHPIFAGDEGAMDTTCGSCHETLESLL